MFNLRLSCPSTYILKLELGFFSIIRLIIGIIFYAFVFAAAALLTQTINKSDIEDLLGMVSGLGIIGKIVNSVLNIVQKLI